MRGNEKSQWKMDFEHSHMFSSICWSKCNMDVPWIVGNLVASHPQHPPPHTPYHTTLGIIGIVCDLHDLTNKQLGK